MAFGTSGRTLSVSFLMVIAFMVSLLPSFYQDEVKVWQQQGTVEYNQPQFQAGGPQPNMSSTLDPNEGNSNPPTYLALDYEASANSTRLKSGRGMTGVWIGNTWVPPFPWRYYTPHELRLLYQDRRTFWIGDSTARRAAMTLYGILNTTTDSNHTSVTSINQKSLIDLNKGAILENCTYWSDRQGHNLTRPRICRNFPYGNGTYSFLWLPCYKMVEEFLQVELSIEDNLTMIQQNDLIILAVGIWEVSKPIECRDANRTMLQRQADVLSLAAELVRRRQVTVVWRTSGFDWKYAENRKDSVRQMNHFAMDWIERFRPNTTMSDILYVDWGGAVEARSFLPDRIAGDLSAHYGLEPRIVLGQMITNRLIEVALL